MKWTIGVISALIIPPWSEGLNQDQRGKSGQAQADVIVLFHCED